MPNPPTLPSLGSLKRIYVIAICGTGMSALARLFVERGMQVRGSDKVADPPTGPLLKSWGVEIDLGYSAANISRLVANGRDGLLIIVGNAVSANHPEVVRVQELGLPYTSFPQALETYFLEGRTPLVVAGTHGKTTTTAALSHILRASGRDPGYLVGGAPLDLPASAGVGTGAEFVVEGDEYDSAFFDKKAKFFHYRPQGLILVSVEYDHGDIYPTVEGYEAAFIELLRGAKLKWPLLWDASFEASRRVVAAAGVAHASYALDGDADVKIRHLGSEGEYQKFSVIGEGVNMPVLRTRMMGRHNVKNLAAAATMAAWNGVAPSAIATAVESFRGVDRRQTVLFSSSQVVIVRDFGHHPTEVRATLEAVAARYPERKIVAVFEPRSYSSRSGVHDALYPAAFGSASRVLLAPSAGATADGRTFNGIAVAESIGPHAETFATMTDLEAAVRDGLRAPKTPEAWVFLSNGEFGSLPERVAKALAD